MVDQRLIKTDIDSFIKSLIDLSLKNNASDIHIQPEENFAKIRLRIDGILSDLMVMRIENYLRLTSKIKILAGMDIGEKRLPQDGAMDFDFWPGVDFRLSSIPTLDGEKLVIRILSVGAFKKASRLVGFSENSKDILEKTIQKKSGMTIFTGPTGSGKSTSLYALIEKLNKEGVNIITIEDPVEIRLENVNQISIKEDIGLTYPKVLRSILRQDPDIIMIGEIRDKKTAEIAIRAAITGHKVFTTLHTRDALSSLTRLKDLGVDEFLIRSAISLLASQRLVRRLCDCKRKDLMTDFEYSLTSKYLEVDRDRLIFRPNGCPKCRDGYLGRQAVEEVIAIDKEMVNILKKYGLESDKLKEKLGKDNFKPMLANGLSQVLEGKTSFEEVLSVLEF